MEAKKKEQTKDAAAEKYLDQLKRVQAEFDNYIKRSAKEREQIELLGRHKLLVHLLPIVDDFDRCAHNVSAETDVGKGIHMVKKAIDKFLEEQSVRRMDVVGKSFDPYVHEVLKNIESDKPEGVIIEEIQTGYLFGDKVLRYAKVIVSKGGKDENNRH